MAGLAGTAQGRKYTGEQRPPEYPGTVYDETYNDALFFHITGNAEHARCLQQLIASNDQTTQRTQTNEVEGLKLLVRTLQHDPPAAAKDKDKNILSGVGEVGPYGPYTTDLARIEVVLATRWNATGGVHDAFVLVLFRGDRAEGDAADIDKCIVSPFIRSVSTWAANQCKARSAKVMDQGAAMRMKALQSLRTLLDFPNREISVVDWEAGEVGKLRTDPVTCALVAEKKTFFAKRLIRPELAVWPHDLFYTNADGDIGLQDDFRRDLCEGRSCTAWVFDTTEIADALLVSKELENLQFAAQCAPDADADADADVATNDVVLTDRLHDKLFRKVFDGGSGSTAPPSFLASLLTTVQADAYSYLSCRDAARKLDGALGRSQSPDTKLDLSRRLMATYDFARANDCTIEIDPTKLWVGTDAADARRRAPVAALNILREQFEQSTGINGLLSLVLLFMRNCINAAKDEGVRSRPGGRGEVLRPQVDLSRVRLRGERPDPGRELLVGARVHRDQRGRERRGRVHGDLRGGHRGRHGGLRGREPQGLQEPGRGGF
jgi:hypothetical protein